MAGRGWLQKVCDLTPLSNQEHKQYRALVGSLTWYTTTRYDIAYEVNRLAQKLSEPTKGAMKGVQRVMAYLKSTWDKALVVPRVRGDTWSFYSVVQQRIRHKGGWVQAPPTPSATPSRKMNEKGTSSRVPFGLAAHAPAVAWLDFKHCDVTWCQTQF